MRKGGENKSRSVVKCGFQFEVGNVPAVLFTPFLIYFVCLTLKSNAQPITLHRVMVGIK